MLLKIVCFMTIGSYSLQKMCKLPVNMKILHSRFNPIFGKMCRWRSALHERATRNRQLYHYPTNKPLWPLLKRLPSRQQPPPFLLSCRRRRRRIGLSGDDGVVLWRAHPPYPRQVALLPQSQPAACLPEEECRVCGPLRSEN
jgi:hypothetical protein